MARREKIKRILLHITIWIAIFIICLPLIYAIIISTRDLQGTFTSPPNLKFGTSAIETYKTAWESVNLGRLLINSGIVAITTSVVKIVLAIMAAFAIVFFDFRGKYIAFAAVFLTQLLPVPVKIVPTFELMKTFQWVDTYYALTFPYFATATGTFLFRQFFMTVPNDLVDAARIDGCSPMTFLRKVLIPLSWNNIGALFLVEFVYMWNRYLWPLIVTNSEDMRVAQIGIKMLMTTGSINKWNIIMAGAIITLIPPLIVLLVLQKTFIEGFVMRTGK
jgi:sn-glycerol 3-phosphate transport system permease protein